MFLLLYIPLMLLIYFFGKTPFTYFIHDENKEEVSNHCWQEHLFIDLNSRYSILSLMIPTFLFINFEALKMYMLAHQVLYIYAIVYPINLILHILITYTLVAIYEMGLPGIAIGFLITEINYFLIFFLFISFTEDFKFVSPLTLVYKKEYIQLSI